MRYVGVDFGKKRVGIAISDEGGKFAFPKAVIPATLDLASKISEFAKGAESNIVVVGESKDFGGRENKILVDIHVLVRQLEGLGLKVVLEPEFSSSVEANRFQGKNDLHDASAAAIILQRFLDKNKN
jgi:putative Holliday junction resolvase